MLALATAVAVTVFAWWFATGLILLADRGPRSTYPLTFGLATVLLVVAVWGWSVTAPMATVAGAYAAFACSLLVWGWIEMAFLMGYIRGPRRHACPAGCHGVAHFRHAVEAIIHHELAIVAAVAVVVAVTWQAENAVGRWTFLALWVMRISAKLNLFLGVRNLGERFLPDHMAYLEGFFRRRAMNPLLPFSLLLGGAATAWWWAAAVSSADASFAAVGSALVATLLGLAVLEHLFMVLPIPADFLWQFGLRKTATTPKP